MMFHNCGSIIRKRTSKGTHKSTSSSDFLDRVNFFLHSDGRSLRLYCSWKLNNFKKCMCAVYNRNSVDTVLAQYGICW